MDSALDVDLHDNDLIAEIGLLADLMVLASESSGPMDAEAIDAALGLFPPAEVVRLPHQRAAG